MLTATQTSTTQSRRSAMKFSAAAVLAGMATPVLAGANRTDPVVALYCRYVALEAASGPLQARAWSLRQSLVDRYGDPRDTPALWAADPDHPKLARLNAQCNSVDNEQADVVDQMRETQATTQEGAIAKLKVILELWRGPDRADMDNYERTTLEFIEDALVVLGKGAGR